MTVGYHAPLPPAPTGVADYAAELLPALRGRVSVHVNAPGDIDLYHLGNNRLHRDIYTRALACPGVVLLHDAVLHHFLLGTLDEHAYVEEFAYNYGAWHEDLARDLWRQRARSASDPRYFEFPMLRRITESARAVLVHNPAAAAMVRSHAPHARVVEIPHLFVRPPEPPLWERMRLRQRLGVPDGAALFGVFGHLRESKRLMAVLRVFDRVHRENSSTALLVAGEFASADLARAAGPLLRRPGITRAGYLSERDFRTHAAAADACVNLRYPSAGETSGITIRLMGAGRAVILTASPENSRFPETACLRVDHGPAEEEMLAASVLWLARNPSSREEIGREASRHVASDHGVEKVADRLLILLAQS
ncbi:MAG: hypothetical protein ACRD44_10535 [Bryobacteraceae bacterium]